MLFFSVHDLRFAVTLLESLNPFSYKLLRERNLLENLSYLSSVVFVCLFIASIYYMPSLASIGSSVKEGFGQFDRLSVSYELKPGASWSNSLYGIEVVGLGRNNGVLNINSAGFSSRNMLCSETQLLCGLFPDSGIKKAELEDLAGNSAEAESILKKMALMSLPGFFFLAWLFFVAKYLALAALFSLAALIISRILRFELNLNSSFAITTYSLTALVIPDMLSSVLGANLLGVQWLLFSVLLITGILITSKKSRGDKHGRGRDTEDKQPGKGTA